MTDPVVPPLFLRVLGEAFAQLPVPVQALHAGPGDWTGEAEVERGRGLLATLCARLTRLPQAGDQPVRVEIRCDADGERWVRRYGRAHAMPSRLWFGHGRLRERLGPVFLEYALAADPACLLWRVSAARCFGCPLPARWFAGVIARESGADGRYRFDVRAELPGVGLLVHYRGWLAVP